MEILEFIWNYSILIIIISIFGLSLLIYKVIGSCEPVDEEELLKYGMEIVPVITGITYQAREVKKGKPELSQEYEEGLRKAG